MTGMDPGGCRSPVRWEHFSHQADIGVRGFGATREEAFEQAALALTGVITAPGEVCPKNSVTIECRAPDVELLLADWLNAVIFEMANRRMLFGAFHVSMTGDSLKAEARGEPVDRNRHRPAVEVKGATYTELKVARLPGDRGWLAQAVLDV
jgi:SHS2 domain-containing protein